MGKSKGKLATIWCLAITFCYCMILPKALTAEHLVLVRRTAARMVQEVRGATNI